MSKSPSSLKELYNLFKPVIVKNQVIFYNLVFIVPENLNDSFISKLKNNIASFLKDNNHRLFINNETTLRFYKLLTGSTEDNPAYFPSIESNQAIQTAARSDVSQMMKKIGESGIPRNWRKKYIKSDEDKMEIYKMNLDIVLKYYLLLYHFDLIDVSLSTTFTSITLKKEIWNKLTYKSKAFQVPYNISSFRQLEDFIVSQLHLQCNPELQLSLQSQSAFYLSHVECYGDKSIDKLYALKTYADENVYCSFKLGNIYFYGDHFYSGKDGIVEIDQNYNYAAFYYERCIHEPYLLIPACWSLGYIYMNNLIGINDDNINKAIQLFIKCENYPPALNSLGLIYKKKADEILTRNNFKKLTSSEKELCKSYCISFVEKCSSACDNNWVYAFNNLYSFYIDEKYEFVRKELIKTNQIPNMDPLYFLQKAVDRHNPWAMDTLALHYIADYMWDNHLSSDNIQSIHDLFNSIKNGTLTLPYYLEREEEFLPENLKKAKEMLHELYKINYARGIFHLAINFYSKHPLQATLLQKASALGNKLAQKAYQDIINESGII